MRRRLNALSYQQEGSVAGKSSQRKRMYNLWNTPTGHVLRDCLSSDCAQNDAGTVMPGSEDHIFPVWRGTENGLAIGCSRAQTSPSCLDMALLQGRNKSCSCILQPRDAFLSHSRVKPCLLLRRAHTQAITLWSKIRRLAKDDIPDRRNLMAIGNHLPS